MGRAVLMALLICYCVVMVPLELAFDRSILNSIGQEGVQKLEIANLTIDCMFIADMLLSFRTGFLVDGRLVIDNWLVARNYLRHGFVVDLLGAFPINFFFTDDGKDDSATRLNRNLRQLDSN